MCLDTFNSSFSGILMLLLWPDILVLRADVYFFTFSTFVYVDDAFGVAAETFEFCFGFLKILDFPSIFMSYGPYLLFLHLFVLFSPNVEEAFLKIFGLSLAFNDVCVLGFFEFCHCFLSSRFFFISANSLGLFLL